MVHRFRSVRPGALSLLALVALTARAPGQEPSDAPLDAAERTAVVETAGAMLEERYVFPDVAEACARRLVEADAAGEFDDVSDPEIFAQMLTEVLQGVSHDKHMRVRVRAAPAVRMQQENPARAQAGQRDRMRAENFGFERVERLDGNIGYLDMRFFAGAPEARPTATAAMNFLAHVDAIIFDMRRNGGGSPDMIRYISSYLFDVPTHLNSLYWREGDHTEEFWTLPDVPGPRLADVPVFVLTSSYTFSGAEEFSNNLKALERATLIGETTGGGANPGGTFPVNQRFGIFIPTGRAINPVTKTNWEGTGVSPHIEVPADDAYDRALELAREAAESHRRERDAARDRLWTAFDSRTAKARAMAADGREPEAERLMIDAIRDAQEGDLLGEADVNMLGYGLLGRDQVELAIAVFRFNVEAYPGSANVHDSLGEAYMTAGRREQAIRSYRKSLELDPGNSNAEAMIERMLADK